MNKLSPAKILIVDDTPANITLLSEILEKKGYQISAARDGEKAIKIADHTQPDLILLDIMMPIMDGFETCQQLKSQTNTKDIPIIFISAKTEMNDLVTAFSVGGVDYINKPFHEDEVNSRIINQLQIRNLHQQLTTSELNMRNLLTNYQFQSDRLQHIVDHVVDAIIEISISGSIQFANPAVEKLFGYPVEELMTVDFSQLLAEPFASLYDEFFETSLLEGEQGYFSGDKIFEITAKRKDGSEFPIDFSFMKISTGKEMYLAVIHDITVHKDKEEKFRSLSNIDPLTNLANRRHFEEVFAKEWLQSRRDNTQIAFIMIDIDYFKPFNDTYGHQVGDDCLKQVAASLSNNAKRPSDMIARIGGEEFAVLLPDTSQEGAVKIAEQLRTDIQALDIPHSGSNYKAVTISLGVAITDNSDQTHSSAKLYQMADEALYEAKNSGRNCYRITTSN
ncbi:MAG: diguanylate cyclase [gamma proteobacterium symbiont of Bathyaustriella thionipta]|nr:diguanylate cyclase [gamma proteobacterium symbiont of Bathyaustriella thionipta]MCU7948717.1 diguanylate cyclase [gamma proteobacterium symbiont of Bathyaustriella thionipta]MCU7954620.1 diguanylate cyclase [gamma proteobacterium symbiont of Bathyaustriella thionipta]MCU7955200.1 diguanylate cyclase [gamma proteobacterium symbiont of Bathyaustriella thionipta]